MIDMKTLDQRLSDLETVLQTVIAFNMNATAVLGRRLSHGNDEIASAIAQDLQSLKDVSFQNVDKALHDGYVDNLTLAITGRG